MDFIQKLYCQSDFLSTSCGSKKEGSYILNRRRKLSLAEHISAKSKEERVTTPSLVVDSGLDEETSIVGWDCITFWKKIRSSKMLNKSVFIYLHLIFSANTITVSLEQEMLPHAVRSNAH